MINDNDYLPNLEEVNPHMATPEWVKGLTENIKPWHHTPPSKETLISKANSLMARFNKWQPTQEDIFRLMAVSIVVGMVVDVIATSKNPKR